MSKIAISSDSTLSISQEKAHELGIFVLPLNVIVDETEYHDGIDITNVSLAKMMRGGHKIKTSTPTPYEIELYFNNIFAQGYDEIIHFTISSHLSSMYDLFTKTCGENWPGKITVIDSLSICRYMAENVLTAKHYADLGLGRDEIEKICLNRRTDGWLFFIPENLTHLKNGGRISPTVAAVGNLLGIKPILAFKNGLIEKEATTRNIKKTIREEIIKLANMKLSPDEYNLNVVVFDTKPELLDMVRKAAGELMPKFDLNVSDLSINVCAHTGPGTIGCGLSKKIGVK
ncbi:MAG: DegV family protein [Bacilli bacterium]|jgi:DegV family protein with EDD domain|nr:DegV family protein [Bacilli bacterium]